MIKTTLQLDGADKFNRNIKAVNSELSVLKSEFKALSAAYDAGDKSAQTISAMYENLSQQVEIQKGKVDALKGAVQTQNEAYEKAKTRLDEAKRKYNEVAEAQGKDSKEAKKAAEEVTKASTAVDRAGRAYDSYRRQLAYAQTALISSTSNLGNFVQSQRNTEVQLESTEESLQDTTDSTKKFSEALKKIGDIKVEDISQKFDKIKSSAEKAAKAVANITFKSAETAAKSYFEVTKAGFETGLKAVETYVTAIGTITTAIGTTSAKTSMDFDAQMSTVQSISGATVEEMEILTAKAREMGETTAFSASESAKALEYMAMAGWDVDDMTNSLAGVINLALSSGEELGAVSDIVTDAMTALGLSAKGTVTEVVNGIEVEVSNAEHFANVLAKTASSSNTNVGILGESFKYVAPLAGAMGASIEDLSIALGLMANSGIKGSMAGNTLKNAISNLVDPTDAQISAMRELGLMTTEVVQTYDYEKIEAAQTAVANKTLALENAQISYNDAVAKYGAESSQAQKAMNNLQKAENNLASAQSTLNEAQQGATKLMAGESLFMDEAGNMKSLAEIMDILREHMKAVDVELVDSEGNLREYEDIMAELSKTEEGLTQAKQIEAAATLFGKRNLSGMLAIINASEEDYRSLTEAIYDCGGAAEEMSAIRMDNLQGDVTLLKSSIESAQLSIAENFTPTLRKVVQSVKKVVDAFNKNGLTGAIEKFESFVPKAIEKINAKLPKLVSGAAKNFNMIVETLLKIGEKLLPTIRMYVIPPVLSGITELAKKAVQMLPSMSDKMLLGAIDLFGGIFDGLNSVMDEVMTILPKTLDWLVDDITQNAPDLFDKTLEFFGNIGLALATAVNQILPEIPGLIGSLADTFSSDENISRFENIFDTLDLAGTLNEVVKNTDFGTVAENLSDVIVSAINGFADFLDDVDWDEVAKSITEFMNGIDWTGIVKAVAKTIGVVVKNTPGLAADIFSGLDAESQAIVIGATFGRVLMSSISKTMVEAGTLGAGFKAIGKKLTTDLSLGASAGGLSFATAFVAAAGAFFVGWDIGTFIREKIGGDKIDEFLEPFTSAWYLGFQSIQEDAEKAKEYLAETFDTFTDPEAYKKDWENITNQHKLFRESVDEYLQPGFDFIAERIDDTKVGWKTMADTVSEKTKKIQDDWGVGMDTIRNSVSSVIESAKNWGSDLIDNFVSGVKEKWDEWESTWEGVGEIVYDLLHHSTPERGLLKHDDEWFPDMMRGFADDIKAYTPLVEKKVVDLATGIKDSMAFDIAPSLSGLSAGYYRASAIAESVGNSYNSTNNDNRNYYMPINITINASDLRSEDDIARTSEKLARYTQRNLAGIGM